MKRLVLGLLFGFLVGLALREYVRTPPALAAVPEPEQVAALPVVPPGRWTRLKRWSLRTKIAVKRFVKFALFAALSVVAVQAISPAGLAGLFEWENIAVVLVASTLAAAQKFAMPGGLSLAVPALTLQPAKAAVIPMAAPIEGVDK